MSQVKPLSAVKKRIIRELPELEEKYGISSNNFIDNDISTDEKNHINELYIDNKTVYIPRDYPFKPPKIFIDNKSYISLLSEISQYYFQELKKMGVICLCCESILCSNRWSPGFKIINILDEYEYNKKIIIKLIRGRYLLEICKKFNISSYEIINKIKSFI